MTSIPLEGLRQVWRINLFSIQACSRILPRRALRVCDTFLDTFSLEAPKGPGPVAAEQRSLNKLYLPLSQTKNSFHRAQHWPAKLDI